MVDADRPQCSTDADCAARGPAFEGAVCQMSMCHVATPWSCLEQPEPEKPTSGSYTTTFLVRDTVSQAPKVGVTARVCRRLDLACSEGISGVMTTDSTGHVSLVVPAAFEGYALFKDPAIATTLYFFDPAVRADLPDLMVSVHTPETAAGIAGLTGVEPSSSLGMALVTTFDCFGAPVAGVRVAAENVGSGAKTFYIRNGLPATAAVVTDATGYSGIVNAMPGTATFSAWLDDLAIGSVTVQVQAGALTILHIVPHGT